MHVHLIRLTSVIKDGVGGPEAGILDLIYSFLLQESGIDFYNHININQIGSDLNEFVLKEGKKVYINIRYPASKDFDLKSFTEKNKIRLNVIHTALLRLSEKDKRINTQELINIRNKVLNQNFSFFLKYNSYAYKKNEKLKAQIIINPNEHQFEFYALIEEDGKEKCRLLIYTGKPSNFYIEDLFFYGSWKNANEFVITGKRKEIEIHVKIDTCSVEYINLTSFNKAPFFELMRAGLSNVEQEKLYHNYIESLPPSIAAILNHNPN